MTDGYLRPPDAVPATISDRQFAHGLALSGIITQAEALAWVGPGTVPPALQAFVDSMPDAAARFDAQMLLSGATLFARAHPLTGLIGAAQQPQWSAAQVDDFWRFCATL